MATNVVRSDSWRRTSSFEAPLERAAVERSRDPQGRGDVERRLPGRELIEEPEGLLREGERQRADAGGGLDRAGLAPGAAATHRLDPLGQSGDRGSLEQGAERDLHAERLAEPRDDLGRQQ